MLKALNFFPCKSSKIYPAKPPDPCESIYLKWTEPNAYEACKQQYNKYAEYLKQHSQDASTSIESDLNQK